MRVKICLALLVALAGKSLAKKCVSVDNLNQIRAAIEQHNIDLTSTYQQETNQFTYMSAEESKPYFNGLIADGEPDPNIETWQQAAPGDAAIPVELSYRR